MRALYIFYLFKFLYSCFPHDYCLVCLTKMFYLHIFLAFLLLISPLILIYFLLFLILSPDIKKFNYKKVNKLLILNSFLINYLVQGFRFFKVKGFFYCSSSLVYKMLYYICSTFYLFIY